MPSNSIQPRFSNTQDVIQWTFTAWEKANEVPPWGNPNRLTYLRDFARTEPILAGALSSMVSKVSSMDWYVSGGRNRAAYGRDLLANACDGDGWNKLLDKWAQDYLGTDFGGALELARDKSDGPVTGVYNFDAATLKATGNRNYPLNYTPRLKNGRPGKNTYPLAPTDFCHIVDMPAPEEQRLDLGFCSVSRAIKAARVLLALYEYDEEKLADMPMPGLVTVSGMLMSELAEAFKLYDAKRDDKQQVHFKQLLWLASAGALQNIDAKLISFADLPENFDREQTVSLYVYTLALDFGVDAREFWPATQSGATKGEAEVQAQKAKGKGFGRMLTNMERALNWNVMPADVAFGFDRQDDDADLAQAILHGQLGKNVRLLWEPAASTGQGILATEEARRLLVEQGALPAWIAPTPDVILYGNSRDEGLKAFERVKMQRWASKAAGANLGPGEDYVRISAQGEYEVLWTSATTYAVPDWPVTVLA
jgi:hypothetical protein